MILLLDKIRTDWFSKTFTSFTSFCKIFKINPRTSHEFVYFKDDYGKIDDRLNNIDDRLNETISDYKV